MTTETPAQRRTRLIEQYVGQLHPHICNCDATIDDAAKLADAVVAATPQPEPEPKPVAAPRPSLQELGMRSTGLVDPPVKAGKLPPHPLLRLDGYPSEAETRLIELVERLLHRFKLPSQDFASIDLATIKRDLGIS